MVDFICCCILVVSAMVSQVCCQSLPGHTTATWLTTTTTESSTATDDDDDDGDSMVHNLFIGGCLGAFLLVVIVFALLIAKRRARHPGPTGPTHPTHTQVFSVVLQGSLLEQFMESMRQVEDSQTDGVTGPPPIESPDKTPMQKPPSYDDVMATDDPPPYSEYESQFGGRT